MNIASARNCASTQIQRAKRCRVPEVNRATGGQRAQLAGATQIESVPARSYSDYACAGDASCIRAGQSPRSGHGNRRGEKVDAPRAGVDVLIEREGGVGTNRHAFVACGKVDCRIVDDRIGFEHQRCRVDLR